MDSRRSQPLSPAPPLMLLGASVRAMAASARRAGFAPVGVDLFSDLDLRRLGRSETVADYPRGFLSAVSRLPKAPWCYGGGLENYPALVDRLAARGPLLGNVGPVLRRIRDPLGLMERLSRLGYPAAETRAVGQGLPTDGSWLSKPRASSGGGGIRPWRGERFSPRQRFLQRFLPGRPTAAVFVAGGGRAALLGATVQLLGGVGAPAFAYAGSIGPLALGHALERQLVSLGQTLAEEFQLIGLFGVDGLLSGDGFVTIEVNPRFPASVEILERACGFSAIALHARACQGDALPARGEHFPPTADGPAARPPGLEGKRVVYAPRTARVPPSLAGMLLDWADDDRWPLAADIPAPFSFVPAGAPVATVFARGDDEADVARSLDRRAKAVLTRLVSDDSPA